MGIRINLKMIPRRISPERWESVYRESLQLVEAYGFMDKVEAVRNGQRYFYVDRTKDRENLSQCGYHGWRSIGDMRTGDNTEEYVLFGDIRAYLAIDNREDNGADILLDGLEGWDCIEKPSCCRNIWGGKSQGEDSHTYLLAIACLIACRLPEAAMVYGDISAGQCQRAIRWANQHLEEPIEMPVNGRRDALAKRLKESALPGSCLPAAFLALTMEAKNKGMGEFLRHEFGCGEFREHYRKRFLQFKISQRGFVPLLKEYLEMGFDFQELCRLAVSSPDGMRAKPEEFLRRIVESKLYVKEKETYDFTKTASERADSEEADDIKELVAKTIGLICGAENRNVDAFYPLEKIRADCKKVFGGECDVDGIIDCLLEEEKDGAGRLQAMLYDDPGSIFRQEVCRAQKERREERKYDVNIYRELIDFVPGCRMRPALEKDLVKNLQMIQFFAEAEFEEFRGLDRIGRENYFIENNRFLLLRKEVWDRIFDRVMDDAYMIRFYGIFSVNCLKKDGYRFCKNLLANLEAFDYFWDRIS